MTAVKRKGEDYKKYFLKQKLARLFLGLTEVIPVIL
jgi:hypothetical protein